MREAPALARIQEEYRARGLKVVAVNVFPQIALQRWADYWRRAGGGDVVYAQDTRREAIRTLDVQTAGATVVLDREGRVVFSDRFATAYETLKDAVERAL